MTAHLSIDTRTAGSQMDLLLLFGAVAGAASWLTRRGVKRLLAAGGQLGFRQVALGWEPFFLFCYEGKP